RPLRATASHVGGATADRKYYDTLIALARKTTNTGERVRYYLAAASARDPELARATLELTLTDELPTTLTGNMFSGVAGPGEQPQLASAFVLQHFEALATKQGPSFRNYFAANFMTNFTDTARAGELAAFAPAQATSGGRMVSARSQEAILLSAELKTRALPAIADWLRKRNRRPYLRGG